MRTRVITFIVLVAALLHPLVQAGQADIKKSLAEILPNVPIHSIKPTGINGLFEARVGAEVYYISKDGRYLINGEIIDMKSRQNLTAIARGQVRLAMINEVSEDRMIIYEPKQVRRTVTVFTDVDCPYCRKLHKDVPELVKGGVRIRYIVFPRDGLESSTYLKSVAVWCSRDRKKALTLAKSGKKFPKKTCDNPIAENLALSRRVGIRGTPTLVVDDGQILPGYIPPAKLFALLGLNSTIPRYDSVR